MEGCGHVSLRLSPPLPRFPSPNPPPLFPSIGESGAFFRMGLVQSPGPFAGGRQACAERLMVALESCQLSLMDVDFAAGLWSLFFYGPRQCRSQMRPTPTASWLQFLELLEMYIIPIWERLASGNTVSAVAFWHNLTIYSSSSPILRIRFNVMLTGSFGACHVCPQSYPGLSQGKLTTHSLNQCIWN